MMILFHSASSNNSLPRIRTRFGRWGILPRKSAKCCFKVREDILNRLIDKTLSDQEIKRTKISAGEEEVDKAIERFKQTRYLTDEDLRKALTEQGLTMAAYRQRLKEQILRTRLVVREVRSKIVITDEDIKAYYEAHPDVYGGEKKYHLKNIMMKLPTYAGRSDREKARKRMAAIVRRLDAGESFERLARKYSQGPLAAEGGDLGMFNIDSLSPQLRDAIAGLGTGTYTPVLETDQGYQIFYIQDIVQSAGKSLAEVTPEIHEKLYNQVVEEKYNSWIKALRGKSHIRIIQ